MGAFVKPTAKGQITLRRGVLEHLGLRAGDRLEVVMLPGGKVLLEPVRLRQPISSLFGLYEPRPGPPVTEEEIQEGIALGAVDAYLEGLQHTLDRDDEAA